MAKITIFGLAGTGTSTTGKALALKLRCDFLSSGSIAREDARERGISIYERGNLAKTDPSFDRVIDERIETFGREHVDCVVESWLAWNFIPDSVKVKLTCDQRTRLERVARRDKVSYEEAERLTLLREKDNAERYLKYYGIADFSSDSHFDLIIDTTSIPVAQVVAKIEGFIT